jgi:hypothetical protein
VEMEIFDRWTTNRRQDHFVQPVEAPTDAPAPAAAV